MEHNEPIRAERRLVPFFEGLEVEGYLMPSGEYRVSITSASRVLGYAENWLYRVLERPSGKTIKTLLGYGFSQQIQEVVSETIRGDRSADTISLDDLNRLIVYAVSQKKKAALALQLSLTKLALNDFFRDAFGEPPLSIEEKRRLFYEAYAAAISPEDWRRMDKQDILRLALEGDEPHLRDGSWNSWEDDEDDH